MQTESSIQELDERLSAYFDGELEVSDRAALDAEVELDGELAEQIADLAFMRAMVVGDLEHQAERVHEARFEQLWDSFELTLERESRLQEAAEKPPGLWQRLFGWARPMRIPLVTAAAASCVLAFVFVKSAGQPAEDEVADNTAEASNKPGDQASDARPEVIEVPLDVAAIEPSPGQVAVAPHPPAQAEMFPQPEPGEAEIRRIEFGGRSGTISQVEGRRGTTTVIWVAEDEVPADSERSL